MKFVPMELVLLLLIVLINVSIIWVVVKWVLYFSRRKLGDSFEIAKIRYAKGEISLAEFNEIKKNIS